MFLSTTWSQRVVSLATFCHSPHQPQPTTFYHQRSKSSSLIPHPNSDDHKKRSLESSTSTSDCFVGLANAILSLLNRTMVLVIFFQQPINTPFSTNCNSDLHAATGFLSLGTDMLFYGSTHCLWSNMT